MVHKHFCRKCNAMMAEGDFDCGHDADHDFNFAPSAEAEKKRQRIGFLRRLVAGTEF
jgi:hypothetical protein